MKNPIVFLTIIITVLFFYACQEAKAADYNYFICWNKVTQDTNGIPITVDTYRILRSSCSSGAGQSITVPGTTNCTNFLSPIGRYCWKVFAKTGAVESVASTVVVFHTNLDTDKDGVPDYRDNCKLKANAPQVDSDADGFGNICDGDLNGDKLTNGADTTLHRMQLAKPSIPPIYNPADFNANGYVNGADTTTLRYFLLGSPPGPAGP